MYLNSFLELKSYVDTLSFQSNDRLMIMIAENSADELQKMTDYLN
jgi:hypothetical protein